MPRDDQKIVTGLSLCSFFSKCFTTKTTIKHFEIFGTSICFRDLLNSTRTNNLSTSHSIQFFEAVSFGCRRVNSVQASATDPRRCAIFLVVFVPTAANSLRLRQFPLDVNKVRASCLRYFFAFVAGTKCGLSISTGWHVQSSPLDVSAIRGERLSLLVGARDQPKTSKIASFLQTHDARQLKCAISSNISRCSFAVPTRGGGGGDFAPLHFSVDSATFDLPQFLLRSLSIT
jgi:hypothetical protein